MSPHRALSGVRVEFGAHWKEAAPSGATNLLAAWPDRAHPVDESGPFDTTAATRPTLPWGVAFDGHDLHLTVGPVPLAGGPIQARLQSRSTSAKCAFSERNP